MNSVSLNEASEKLFINILLFIFFYSKSKSLSLAITLSHTNAATVPGPPLVIKRGGWAGPALAVSN
jgi:hypothetical protein